MYVGIKKGPTTSGLNDLTDHLMVELEIIIALASMTCIVDLDAYGLHQGDEQVFNNFINEC